jgi:hypothetical protein
MPLDLPSGKIYAHSYEGFKADLSNESQATSTGDYKKAAARNKAVVFVRDKDTRWPVAVLFVYEGTEPFGRGSGVPSR